MNRMFERSARLLATGFLAMLLAACAGVGVTPSPPSGPGAVALTATAPSADGNAVAADLARRYVDTTTSCSWGGNAHLPAALCSGILFRATTRGAGYHVWNPNPSSRIPNGVSFSWLRRDNALTGVVFNYTNGFILIPAVEAGSLTKLSVECVYAFDADTFNRTGGARDGCAEHPSAAGTGPCQGQAIFTGAQWRAKFTNVSNRYTQQCGFRVSEGTPDADSVFLATRDVRRDLNNGSTALALHNEIMVKTWAQNDANIPIEAFFFIAGKSDGKTQAIANQADFTQATGRRIPVIEMTLPTTLNGPASFRFDQ